MQQKSDDVRRYGIACSKAAVLKAFLILLRWTNTPLLGFVLPSTRTWEDVHKMKSMPGWLVRGTFHWIILVVDLCMFHLRTTQGLDCPSLGLGQNLTYPLFLGKMSSTITPQLHRFSTDFGTPKWALGFFAASHRWSMAVSLKSLWPSSRWSTHRPLETQPQRGHGGRGGLLDVGVNGG